MSTSCFSPNCIIIFRHNPVVTDNVYLKKYTITVPPMALTESQVVILNFSIYLSLPDLSSVHFPMRMCDIIFPY